MPGKELWSGWKMVEGFLLSCSVIPYTIGESAEPCLHRCQKLTHHLGLPIVAVYSFFYILCLFSILEQRDSFRCMER